MKYWLGLFAVLGLATVLVGIASVHMHQLTPEEQYRLFSDRCDRVQAAMREDEVDRLFGLDPKRPRTFIGIFGPGLPYITTYRPSGSGDERYLEVTFRSKKVVEKRLCNPAAPDLGG
jgi:hypothetical protein